MNSQLVEKVKDRFFEQKTGNKYPSFWKRFIKDNLASSEQLASGLTLGLTKSLFGESENAKQYRKDHPYISKFNDVASDLLSYVTPAKAVAKVAGKIIAKKGIKGLAARGLAYGGSHGAAKSAIEGDNVIKGAIGDTVGYMAGEGMLKGISGRLPLFLNRPGNKMKIGRAKVAKIAEKINAKIGNVKGREGNLIENPTEKSKALADEIYLNSPKARKIITGARDRFYKNQGAEMEKALAKSEGTKELEGLDNWLKKNEDISKVKENKLFEKAFENKKPVNLSDKLKGDVQFQRAHKKTMSGVNQTFKGKPGYEPYSTRQLHETKSSLGQEWRRASDLGKSHDAKKLADAMHPLEDTLKKSSRTYRHANATSKRRFQVSESAKEGKNFLNKTTEDIKADMSRLNRHQREAYRKGVIARLAGKAEKSSTTSANPNIAKDLSNPHVADKVRASLGEDRANDLINTANRMNKAKASLDFITNQGSKTAEHTANVNARDIITGIGVAHGSPRATVRAISKIGNIAKGSVSKDQGGTVAKLLLNPKLLAKFTGRTKPVQNFNLLASLINQMRSTDNKENEEL